MERNPMPDEYKGMRRTILCNDCEQTNEVDYHFVYNKVDLYIPCYIVSKL